MALFYPWGEGVLFWGFLLLEFLSELPETAFEGYMIFIFEMLIF